MLAFRAVSATDPTIHSMRYAPSSSSSVPTWRRTACAAWYASWANVAIDHSGMTTYTSPWQDIVIALHPGDSSRALSHAPQTSAHVSSRSFFGMYLDAMRSNRGRASARLPHITRTLRFSTSQQRFFTNGFTGPPVSANP